MLTTLIAVLPPTARSSLPSPLKSPTATDAGSLSVRNDGAITAAKVVERVTSKKTVFEAAPAMGLTTATEAVPALATSEAKIVAVSRDLLTNVVARALLFHFTTDPDTNPVPFTVSVNPAAPGRVASGLKG